MAVEVSRTGITVDFEQFSIALHLISGVIVGFGQCKEFLRVCYSRFNFLGVKVGRFQHLRVQASVTLYFLHTIHPESLQSSNNIR